MLDYKSSRYKIVTVECYYKNHKKLPQKRYYNPLCKKKINTIRSLPMWACGLKPSSCSGVRRASPSLPMWACGLKPNVTNMNYMFSVTPHVGVWIETSTHRLVEHGRPRVTPHVGVWIETP